MNSQIVRTLDKNTEKYLQRYFFGLNIFQVNKVVDNELDDLQLEFLRNICSQNRVSANTGSLYDFGHTPKDLFGSQNNFGGYEAVEIGCYRGIFYDSKHWNLFPPLFFRNINSEFINITNEDESLIYDILYSDALAFFIAPKTEKSVENLLELLKSPFSSNDDFIEESLKFYDLVMTTHADGDYFTGYSQSTKSFDLLEKPLNVAAKYVENSSWYKENIHKLVWDGKHSMCLCLE